MKLQVDRKIKRRQRLPWPKKKKTKQNKKNQETD